MRSVALGDSYSIGTGVVHPSAAQYARWLDVIEPAVRAMLALPSGD